MSMSVCVCVGLSVCLRNSKIRQAIFLKFLVPVPCGRGLVLLWRRCDMLRTLYFRFYGWRHVFILWDQWAGRHGVVWFAMWRCRWAWLLAGHGLLRLTGSAGRLAGAAWGVSRAGRWLCMCNCACACMHSCTRTSFFFFRNHGTSVHCCSLLVL